MRSQNFLASDLIFIIHSGPNILGVTFIPLILQLVDGHGIWEVCFAPGGRGPHGWAWCLMREAAENAISPAMGTQQELAVYTACAEACRGPPRRP